MAFFSPSWVYSLETMAKIPKPQCRQLSNTQVNAEKNHPRQLLQDFVFKHLRSLFPGVCSGRYVSKGHFKSPRMLFFLELAEEERSVLNFTWHGLLVWVNIKGWNPLLGYWKYFPHWWWCQQGWHHHHIQGYVFPTEPRAGLPLAKSLPMTAIESSREAQEGSGLGSKLPCIR